MCDVDINKPEVHVYLGANRHYSDWYIDINWHNGRFHFRKIINKKKEGRFQRSERPTCTVRSSFSVSFIRRWSGEEIISMGGFAIGSAFDSKSGQIIMAALLFMIVSFYAGTLFGNNAPLYISNLPSSSNTSSSSNGNNFKPHSLVFTFRFHISFIHASVTTISLFSYCLFYWR